MSTDPNQIYYQTLRHAYNQMLSQSYNDQLSAMGAQQYGIHRSPYPQVYGSALTGASPGYAGALANQFPVAQAQCLASTAEPIEDAGIRAGEIIACRCWRVQRGWLRSMAVDKVWLPGEVMSGDVEGHAGHVGVHAFKTISQAFEYGFDRPRELIAIGRVRLWGRVVEHTLGYRAEFARIVAISELLEEDGIFTRLRLRRLRRRYGVTKLLDYAKPT